MPVRRVRTLQAAATLELIPALEFLFWPRLSADRKTFWMEKWMEAGGQFYGDRMIALKNDPVWRAMTGAKRLTGEAGRKGAFSTRSIRRPEAQALGLIGEWEELDLEAFTNENPSRLVVPIKRHRE